MIDFRGHRFERDLILTSVRWYLVYPLSDRNLEEMLAERGVEVDHSSVYRWVQKFTPQLEAAFRKGQKRPVGTRWRMDETYIKIKGQWKTSTALLIRTARRSTSCSRRIVIRSRAPFFQEGGAAAWPSG